MDLNAVVSGTGIKWDGAQNRKIVAVRLPRWEFERFPGEDLRLDARMKSTGAVMGLGHTFLQAFLKAYRAGRPRHPLPVLASSSKQSGADVFLQRLVSPSPDRLAVMHAALKQGASAEDVAAVTGIALYWIRQLAELVDLEADLLAATAAPLPAALADRAMQSGFNASVLAHLLKISVDDAKHRLSATTLQTVACSASDTGRSRIWFHAAAIGTAPHAPLGKSVLVVAPGAARIGQSIELDHCCAHAAKALHAAGRKVVMASANPTAAVGADDVDRTYVEPMTAEDIDAICKAEKPESVILQFGGYRAMNLAAQISASGIPVLGTPHDTITLSQNRLRFSRLLTGLGIPHPQIGVAETPDGAMDLAESIAYPILASSVSAHQSRRQTILMDATYA